MATGRPGAANTGGTAGPPDPSETSGGDAQGPVGGLAADVGPLLSAHAALAKQEVSEAARTKATGAGLLVGTAVFLWLALQGLLIAAGAALALVMPVWAAALIVAGVLLLAGVVLALVGKRKLAAPMSVEATKAEVTETVRVVRERLGRS